MKTCYFIVVLFLSSYMSTNAQEFSIGVKGGLNYFSIGDINSRGGSIESGKPDALFSPKKEMGTQFGAYFNVEFGRLFIRPELNFISSKNSYDFPDKTANWKPQKLTFL